VLLRRAGFRRVGFRFAGLRFRVGFARRFFFRRISTTNRPLLRVTRTASAFTQPFGLEIIFMLCLR